MIFYADYNNFPLPRQTTFINKWGQGATSLGHLTPSSMKSYFMWIYFFLKGASLVSLVMVKNLSAMHKTWVQSLGQEDPLEEEMATHSSIIA